MITLLVYITRQDVLILYPHHLYHYHKLLCLINSPIPTNPFNHKPFLPRDTLQSAVVLSQVIRLLSVCLSVTFLYPDRIVLIFFANYYYYESKDYSDTLNRT